MKSFNKYTLIGIAFIIIGIPLSAVWIGFPLMAIGFIIGGFGIIYHWIKVIPGLDSLTKKLLSKIKDNYEPYSKRETLKK